MKVSGQLRGHSCQNGRALALPLTRLNFLATFVLATVAALVLGATPASAWFLSPNSANSSGASDANTLYWISLVVAVVLVLAINLVLVRSLRRFRAERDRPAEPAIDSPRTQLRVGGGLAAFAVVMLVLGIVFTEKSMDVQASGTDEDAITIKATGQQWLWRYDYPNDSYSYFRLTVPVDTEVTLDVVSTDVVHSWYVPQLGGKVDAVPGKHNSITFKAEREGLYPGGSAIFSGQAYAAMRTEVEVVSKDEFESLNERRKTETQQAQDSAARTYNERQGDN